MNSATFFIIISLSILISSYGIILLKKGARNNKNTHRISLNKNIILGTSLLGLSLLINIFLMKGREISFIYPLTAITYGVIALMAIKFLKEKMNKYKWIGIFLILLGSILISI